jgi:hypothetical protein
MKQVSFFATVSLALSVIALQRSAHLDSAQSEKIIPYGHGGFQSPESIVELLRILRLHVSLNPLLRRPTL